MYAVADDLTDIVNFMVFVASPRRCGAPGGRGVQTATEKMLWRPPQGKWRRLGAIWHPATAKRTEARRGGRHRSWRAGNRAGGGKNKEATANIGAKSSSIQRERERERE